MATHIPDTNIWIGDSDDAHVASSEQFDVILNVAIDLDIGERFKWRHKIGLVDGPGNHPLTFISAVLMLHVFASGGKRVLIHCQAGQSRSVMVAATYVSVIRSTDFTETLEQVMLLRKVTEYRPALYNLAFNTIPIIKQLTI